MRSQPQVLRRSDGMRNDRRSRRAGLRQQPLPSQLPSSCFACAARPLNQASIESVLPISQVNVYTQTMKKRVYVETSVFSLYHDRRAESSYRREITRNWWRDERRSYDVFTSLFAVQEVGDPSYPGWEKVLAMARRLPLLEVTPDISGIVKVYIENQLMPADDVGDAAHLAIASYHSVDYLLTWNCRHLANANKFEHIRRINRRLGLLTPELVTPELLFGEDAHDRQGD